MAHCRWSSFELRVSQACAETRRLPDSAMPKQAPRSCMTGALFRLWASSEDTRLNSSTCTRQAEERSLRQFRVYAFNPKPLNLNPKNSILPAGVAVGSGVAAGEVIEQPDVRTLVSKAAQGEMLIYQGTLPSLQVHAVQREISAADNTGFHCRNALSFDGPKAKF